MIPRTGTLEFYTRGNTDELEPHKRSSVPRGDKLLIHAKLLKGFGHAAQTLVSHEAAVLSHAIHLLRGAVSYARQICLDFIFYALLANSCLRVFEFFACLS